MTNQEDRSSDLTNLSKQIIAALQHGNMSQDRAEYLTKSWLHHIARIERARLISGDEKIIRETIHTRLHEVIQRTDNKAVHPAALLADVAGKILQGKEHELYPYKDS